MDASKCSLGWRAARASSSTWARRPPSTPPVARSPHLLRQWRTGPTASCPPPCADRMTRLRPVGRPPHRPASRPAGRHDSTCRGRHVSRTRPRPPAEDTWTLVRAADADGREREAELQSHHVGYVPDWFGMTPYPYQRIGALRGAAGGRRLLADAPGLGKSVQAILAAVLLAAKRWIVVCPPVAQSGWAAEIDRCCGPEHLEIG